MYRDVTHKWHSLTHSFTYKFFFSVAVDVPLGACVWNSCCCCCCLADDKNFFLFYSSLQLRLLISQYHQHYMVVVYLSYICQLIVFAGYSIHTHSSISIDSFEPAISLQVSFFYPNVTIYPNDRFLFLSFIF